MKHLALAVAAACTLLATGAQAAGDPPALAPFKQFVDAMNAGDVQKAKAEFTASPTIIDEFAPYIWNSFAGWNEAAAKSFKAEGVTDPHIALSSISFKNMDTKTGYGVVPGTLTYKVKGKPAVEKGLFTFTTRMTDDGWRITGWAWSTL